MLPSGLLEMLETELALAGRLDTQSLMRYVEVVNDSGMNFMVVDPEYHKWGSYLPVHWMDGDKVRPEYAVAGGNIMNMTREWLIKTIREYGFEGIYTIHLEKEKTETETLYREVIGMPAELDNLDSEEGAIKLLRWFRFEEEIREIFKQVPEQIRLNSYYGGGR